MGISINIQQDAGEKGNLQRCASNAGEPARCRRNRAISIHGRLNLHAPCNAHCRLHCRTVCPAPHTALAPNSSPVVEAYQQGSELDKLDKPSSAWPLASLPTSIVQLQHPTYLSSPPAFRSDSACTIHLLPFLPGRHFIPFETRPSQRVPCLPTQLRFKHERPANYRRDSDPHPVTPATRNHAVHDTSHSDQHSSAFPVRTSSTVYIAQISSSPSILSPLTIRSLSLHGQGQSLAPC